MFRDKIRRLLSGLSATWVKRYKTPATKHKDKVAANDVKRPPFRAVHKPKPPVKPASNM
jgi:hypothetical protein